MTVERIPTTGPAKLFAAGFVAQQLCFHVYHHNSYANNPVMLRSPKPLIMRDIFLTKSSGVFPNPLSCFYVPHRSDMFANIAAAWAIGVSGGSAIGVAHLIVCYMLGGLCSSFAYLFQGQINQKKWNTIYDCNASSTGAWCSLCALTWMSPQLRLPLSRKTPLYYFTIPYAARALYIEYLDYFTERPPNIAQLTNWGCVGGIFFGLIYFRLMMLTRADKGTVNKIFNSLSNAQKSSS